MTKYKTAEEYVNGYIPSQSLLVKGLVKAAFNAGRESTQPDTSKSHPHYKLIEQYFREFGEWKVEYKPESGLRWLEPTCYGFDGDGEYHLVPAKPKMMRLGNKTFPAPETEPLKIGQIYYRAAPGYQLGYVECFWCNTADDFHFLEAGMVYLTKEHTIQRSEAMLAMEPVPPGEDESCHATEYIP